MLGIEQVSCLTWLSETYLYRIAYNDIIYKGILITMILQQNIPYNFFNLSTAYRARARRFPDFDTAFIAAYLVAPPSMDEASIGGACTANHAKFIALGAVAETNASGQTTANR